MNDITLMWQKAGELDGGMTHEARMVRGAILEAASLIGRVSNEEEQATAVAVQQDIATLEKNVETARQEVKKPALEYGRKVDATAQKFLEDVKSEKRRIAILVGNYQTALLAQQRAEEAKQNAQLADFERRRQTALAEAKTHEQRDEINQLFDMEVKEASPPIVREQAPGQIVREQWKVQITNEFLLLRARPELVRKVEFDMVALKALLSAGEKLPGVVAEREVVSTVRAKTNAVVNV